MSVIDLYHTLRKSGGCGFSANCGKTNGRASGSRPLFQSIAKDFRVSDIGLERDVGNVGNPLIVDGQIQGGVAHGIGMTLYERMRFDETGQPLTVTYADYLLPTSDCVPSIEIHHMESPTPLNPLGVKGAAESGTIGAPPAIVSAIEDALRPLEVRITDLPVTPDRLRALLSAARRR